MNAAEAARATRRGAVGIAAYDQISALGCGLEGLLAVDASLKLRAPEPR